MGQIFRRLLRTSYMLSFITLYLLKVLTKPKEARAFLGNLYVFAYHRRKHLLKQVDAADLFPRIYEVAVTLQRAALKYEQGNVDYSELYLLCALTRYIKAKNMFEIGTFDGITTLNLALNSEADARIFTLDLPASLISSTRFVLSELDKKLADKACPGVKFKGLDLEYKIEQLMGDSATFDFSPFYQKMDLIFVDGSHQYNYVKVDSENAFKMLRPGGVIIWDDYATVHWGVTKALHELFNEKPLYWIKDTGLVIFIG